MVTAAVPFAKKNNGVSFKFFPGIDPLIKPSTEGKNQAKSGE